MDWQVSEGPDSPRIEAIPFAMEGHQVLRLSARTNPRGAQLAKLYEQISELSGEIAWVEQADHPRAGTPLLEESPFDRSNSLRRALIFEELKNKRRRLVELEARANELEPTAQRPKGYRLDDGLLVHRGARWLSRMRPRLQATGDRPALVRVGSAESPMDTAPHAGRSLYSFLRLGFLAGLILILGASAIGMIVVDPPASIQSHESTEPVKSPQLVHRTYSPVNALEFAASAGSGPTSGLGVSLSDAQPEPRAPATSPRSAVISRPGFNLREQPSLDGRVLAVLASATEVLVLAGGAESDGFLWIPVQTASEKTGWVVLDGVE